MKKSKIMGLFLPLVAMSLIGCDDKKVEYQTDNQYHWVGDDESQKGEHEFEPNEEKSVAATCKAKGKTVQTCKICGYDKEEVIRELSHKYENDEAASTASTCTVKGKQIQRCSLCGDTKETPLKLADHELVDDPTAAETATCSKPGKTVKKCKNCEYTEDTKIPALPHTLDAGVEKTDDQGKAYKEYTCSTCGGKVTNRVAINTYTVISEGVEIKDKELKVTQSPVGEIGWDVQLPAGDYDVYFDAKFSGSSGANRTFETRKVEVKYNDVVVEYDTSKTAEDYGLNTSTYTSFTFCSITATGGIDKMTLKNPNYRLIFDLDSYIVFIPAGLN